jgi:cyanophycinase-like exopeptidase
MSEQLGLVILFGSGETSASGRKVHDWLMQRCAPPVRVAVLETPAGFQPNSAVVAEKMADFVRHHLQNYEPQVTVVPARKRDTPFSPDNPEVVAPLLRANVFFWGPGSPTYAVRQLRDSLAWQIMVARHRLGAAMVMASAAVIASSSQALPVYEIYKVGADLHWCEGLDFFGAYGLSLILVTHWNNAEGGEELDTSHGFVGRARFEELLALLPSPATVIGIDEHTALVMDLGARTCQVMGLGGVTLLREGDAHRFPPGKSFPITELGPFRMTELEAGIPGEVWERVLAAQDQAQAEAALQAPPQVAALVEQREAARARRDWETSDDLREQIAAFGWEVRDTSTGPELTPL